MRLSKSKIRTILLPMVFVTVVFFLCAESESIAQGVVNLDTSERFNTITEAINDTDTLNGHTLSVDPGTYYENPAVDKILTIQSASGDPQDTVVEGNGDFVFEILARGVTLDAITIRSNGLSDAVGISKSFTSICNCVITENKKGIYVPPPAVIEQTRIIDNTFFANNRSAVELYRSPGSTISGNSMTGNSPSVSSTTLYLFYCANSTVSNNIVTDNGYMGMGIYSDNCLITDNVISNNSHGGLLMSLCSNNTLTDNIISGHERNFGIGSSPSYFHNIDTTNTVDGKPIYYYVNQQNITVPSDAGFVAAVGCENINASDLTFVNSYSCLLLSNTNNSTFSNISGSSEMFGVLVEDSDNNTFNNIQLSDITGNGFELKRSHGNTFTGCSVAQCNYGFRVSDSTSNTMTSCTIESCSIDAINIDDSDLNLVESCSIDTCENGFYIYKSDHNTARDCIITNCGENGLHLVKSSENEMEGCTISYSGLSGIHISNESPSNRIMNCLIVDSKRFGIYILESPLSEIIGNHISRLGPFYLSTAILFNTAHASLISGNTMLGGGEWGFKFSYSDHLTIENNIIAEFRFGIEFNQVNYSLIRDNSFLHCLGSQFRMYTSNDNTIYHNDFLSSLNNVSDNGTNAWDDGYPSGGNYWSTYTGVDLDGDGIGDSPRHISGGSVDNYPLMTPANRMFFSDWETLSEITGGQVDFSIEGGTSNAGRTYLVVGGISGTNPGQALPGGLVTLPVNFDDFTNLIVFPYLNTAYFVDFLGQLDAHGRAYPTLNAPALPGFAGITMHYAFCCNSPFDLASNAVEVEVLP